MNSAVVTRETVWPARYLRTSSCVIVPLLIIVNNTMKAESPMMIGAAIEKGRVGLLRVFCSVIDL